MNPRIDDLIALAALGELTADEAAELDAAIVADPSLASELADALDSAAALQTSPVETPPPALRASVLAAIAGIAQTVPDDGAPAPDAAPQRDDDPAIETRITPGSADEVPTLAARRRRFAPLLAAAAVLALVVGGAIIVTNSNSGRRRSDCRRRRGRRRGSAFRVRNDGRARLRVLAGTRSVRAGGRFARSAAGRVDVSGLVGHRWRADLARNVRTRRRRCDGNACRRCRPDRLHDRNHRGAGRRESATDDDARRSTSV